MYNLFIFENEHNIKSFIDNIIKTKSLYLDNEEIYFDKIKKKDIKYVTEKGRSVVPLSKKERNDIKYNAIKAGKLIKKAKNVFLIREDKKIRLK